MKLKFATDVRLWLSVNLMKKNFGIFNLTLILIIFVVLDYLTKSWAIENLFIEYKSIKLTSFLSFTPV